MWLSPFQRISIHTPFLHRKREREDTVNSAELSARNILHGNTKHQLHTHTHTNSRNSGKIMNFNVVAARLAHRIYAIYTNIKYSLCIIFIITSFTVFFSLSPSTLYTVHCNRLSVTLLSTKIHVVHIYKFHW